MTEIKASNGFGLGLIPLIAGIVAAIMTQNVFVGLGVLVLGIVYGAALFVTFIPVLGMVVWWVGMNMLTPILITFLRIPPEVLPIVNALYWVEFAFGIIITILMVIFLMGTFCSQPKITHRKIDPQGYITTSDEVYQIAWKREQLERLDREICELEKG